MPLFVLRKRNDSIKESRTLPPAPKSPRLPRTKSVPNLRAFWTKDSPPPLPITSTPRTAARADVLSFEYPPWVHDSRPPIVVTDETADLRYTSGSHVYTQRTSMESPLQYMSSISTVSMAYLSGEESKNLGINQTPSLPGFGHTPNNPGPSVTDQNGSMIQNSSKFENGVDWVDDNVIISGSDAIASVNAVVSMTTAMDSIDEAQLEAAERAITTVLDASQAILKVLDLVSDMHPAVAAVVGVFKFAIELELKRRDNNRKIGALRVQRLEMMQIVVDLTKVSDPHGVASEPSITAILKAIKKDMEDCLNGCESYLQVKLAVQVLKAPAWNAKLADFGDRFQARKTELQQNLAIHTSLGVDNANKGIANLQQSANSTSDAVNMMLLMQMLQSPKEKKLMDLIMRKGGAEAVIQNDKLLSEIASSKEARDFSSARGGKNRSGDDDLRKLRKDLKTDVDATLQRNRIFFDRRFKSQGKQLKNLGTAIVEGFRKQQAGPGDNIKDDDIRKMWQDNGWKGSVKTSRFVLSFRDYLIELFSTTDFPSTSAVTEDKDIVQRISRRPSQADEWALSYINIVRLQPINEAFDGDASGFVSVKEVNDFSESRPEGWSLPHWMAFWAAGWHLSLHQYADKITRELIPYLLEVAKRVLPENRAAVDRYLCSRYLRDIDSMANAIHESHDDDSLLQKFQSYVDDEETRLDSTLLHFKYEIDAPNTLEFITGGGRIEQFIMPLIYLILKHHCKIITLCTEVPIDESKLYMASRTWETCYDAMAERLDSLVAVFKQQHLPPDQELKHVAFGMFEHMLSPEPSNEEVSRHTHNPFSHTFEIGPVDAGDLDCHLVPDHLDIASYDNFSPVDETVMVSPTSSTSEVVLLDVSGFWDGFYQDEWRENRMCLNVKLRDWSLTGSGSDLLGAFDVTGTVSVHDSSSFERRIEFCKTYKDGVLWDHLASLGRSGIIEGKWGIVDRETRAFNKKGTFYLVKRCMASSLRSRPTRKTFQENQGLALWNVAATAVRQYLWSWSFFKDRRDVRRRFVQLYSRHKVASVWSHHIWFPYLTSEELNELERFEHTLDARDIRFYVSLAQREIRQNLIVHNVHCVFCNEPVLGSRTFCLDCPGSSIEDTVDFCNRHLHESALRADLTMHSVTHFMIKVRRYAHYRTLPWLRLQAKDKMERVCLVFPRIDRRSSSEQDTNSPSAGRVPTSGNDSFPDVYNVTHLCCCCRTPLTRPFWCCIECDDHFFLCAFCEAREVQNWIDHNRTPNHNSVHPLLRIPVIESKEERKPQPSLDARLVALEQRLDNVDRRFSEIELLLRQLLSKASE